jgi:hypothetical protein
MSAAYVPREGTVPASVIAYLTEHGGTLTGRQITDKFGAGKSSATLLRKAVLAGLLVSTKDGRQAVYSLPDAAEEVDPDAPLRIATHSDGDVSVAGGQPCEDGSVMYSRTQIEQLIRGVTTPHIVLSAMSAP